MGQGDHSGMLPNDNFHWVESEDGAFLQWRYACVALVRARTMGEDFNRVEIYARRFIQSRAGSVEQGKRHIERWVAKQTKFPRWEGAGALRLWRGLPRDQSVQIRCKRKPRARRGI